MPHHQHHPHGTLRLHRRFHSRGLRNCRDVVVWLPPGYGRGRRRHPVVYFQDGQNILDPLTAFLGNSWRAGETAARLIRAGEIVAPIMVGVYNTGFNRMNEYAPTSGEFTGWAGEKCLSNGDAKRYARFFVHELKPFIDARYLTRSGPRTTAVAGSSMGALVSLYLALWHPRTFGHVGALSPSVWWDNRVVLRDFSALRKKPDVRVWLDTGTAEPGWEVVGLLRDTLVARGWQPGGDLQYHEAAGGEHTESAWAERLGEVLGFFFPREKPAQRPPARAGRRSSL